MQRYLANPAVQGAIPPGKVLRWSNDTTALGGRIYRGLYVLDARPIITGEYLTDAKPNQSPTEGTIVEFTLNNEGGRRFRNETAKHIGDYMAIVLDSLVMNAAVIQSAIGTRGQITLGGRDLQAAQDLALVLRAGALPVPLKIAEVRNIGPSLGADSIQKSLHAGTIALALVVIIMIGYYRFSGFLAVCGLAVYTLYTLAALAGFDATLTLPGLAGFVLSIGMAVDANVLIFERIREELDHGKSTRLAIDEGFRHALPGNRRLQCFSGTYRRGALSVRDRPGPRIRCDPARRYRRFDDHRDLRRPDLLHHLADPQHRPAGTEHINAANIP